jgi:hypothetical protein
MTDKGHQYAWRASRLDGFYRSIEVQIPRLIGVTAAWPGDRPQYYPAAGRDEGEMAAGDLDVAIAADQEIGQPGRSRSGIKIR